MSCTVSLASTKSTRSHRSKGNTSESSLESSNCASNQTISFAQPVQSSRKSNIRKQAKGSCKLSKINESDHVSGTDSNDDFTPSGCEPPKTVGPLNKRLDHFTKYVDIGRLARKTAKTRNIRRLWALPGKGNVNPFIATDRKTRSVAVKRKTLRTVQTIRSLQKSRTVRCKTWPIFDMKQLNHRSNLAGSQRKEVEDPARHVIVRYFVHANLATFNSFNDCSE